MSLQVSRNPDVDFAPMKNESVLFQTKTNQFCLLNATATFLWNQLDQSRSVSELADRLCQRFDGVTTTEALRDVEKLVEELGLLDCMISSKV
ncbi:MAG: PqqD family protein [Candidatus Eremiobacteraeota bacterium]|nr:PqqD family protein [Candidatus Eremiobacteraeota bacterium]